MKSTRMCSTFAALCAAAMLSLAPAYGQAPTGGAMGGQQGAMGAQQNPNATGMQSMQNMNMNANPNTPSPTDKAFVKKALQGSMAEVQMGQMIVGKTSNDQVKQFAQRMVDDHTKLIDQMKPVAQQIGVSVPSGPDKKDQAMMTKLQGMSGDALDKAYMQNMVKDHEKDLHEFQQESSGGQDQQVKEAAQQGSQVIQSHLEQARQVASAIGATTGKGGKMGKMSKMGASCNGQTSSGAGQTSQQPQ